MRQFLTLFFLLLCVANKLHAQQDPQYSQYMFNTLVINPAYAGYKETLNLSGIYRNQWTGVDGAPQTQTLVLDGSFFNDKVGLALGVVNDKSGLIGKFSTYLNYAYKIPIANEGILAFGIAAGFSQNSYDAAKATYEQIQNPGFLEGKYNYIDPDARFGVYFSTNRFYAGLSATNLISSFLSDDDKARRTIISQANHFFITAGYLFDINDFLKCKPSILIKEDTKGPTGIDGNLNFLIADKFWIGGAYRSNVKVFGNTDFIGDTRGSGLVGLIQFVGSTWNVGYSYDYSVSSIKSFNPSHEISVGFVLNRKNDFGILSPRYF